jgi:transcriptional regulator with XRE-family HTH domain
MGKSREDEQTMTELEDGEAVGAYASKVGSRLRAIRRQKRLSLQDVEAASSQEFKASVLGAYERGERAISVPRLQRLARFYRVPVDQLLPGDDGPDFGPRPGDGDLVIDLTQPRGAHRLEGSVKLDLAAMERIEGTDAEMLARYLRMIQVQRGDFNGRVLTVRRDDLRAIACILDVTPDLAIDRLEGLGVLYEGKAAPATVSAS